MAKEKLVKTAGCGLLAAACLSAGLIRPVTAAELTTNGYFGVNYEDDNRAAKHGSFDTFVLSLTHNIQVNDKTRIMAQVDWEHAPYFEAALESDGKKSMHKRSSGEVTLSNAYAEYTVSDFLKIKAGKFFTPMGLQNLLFYALPATPYLKIPRESVYKKGGAPYTVVGSGQEDAVFFQRYAQGVWLGGKYTFSKTDVSYDLFAGNGRTFIDHADDNGNKAVGGRLQVSLPFQFGVAPIVSYYAEEFNAGTPGAPVWKKQSSVIPGIALSAGDFMLNCEYAKSGVKKADGSKDVDFSAFYTDIYWTLAGKITPYFRYEFYDKNTAKAGNSETETTIGVAYHFLPWASQIKLQVRVHDFKDTTKKSYNIYGAGVALAF